LRVAFWAGLRLGALLVAAAALLGAMVVWPPIRQPASADAVVLLSGDPARLTLARRLMDAGTAPTLVMAGRPDTGPVAALCTEPQPFKVVCLRPAPDTTRTEAEVTGQLAQSRRWRSMVVVTSRYHATRARMLFRRCFGGTVDAVGDPPTYGSGFALRQIAHEWLGLVHASLMARGC
jgi:uncharacterized SAM-binding protein YcdF (DUF218 family)